MDWLTQPDSRGRTYSCCRLLTAMNARIFFGLSIIEPGTSEFERLVDLSACRHGSVIFMGRVLRCLRLRAQGGPMNLGWIRARLHEGRPVGIEASSPDQGYHSSLVILASSRAVRLVNWLKVEPVTDVLWGDLHWFRCSRAHAFSLLD